MTNARLIKNYIHAVSFISMAAGIMVMAGWFLGIEAIKSILPGWVNMKFTTALCFFLSGISLYCVKKIMDSKKNSDPYWIILSGTTMIILLIMGGILISTFWGLKLGIDNLFIKETELVQSIVQGRPALPTMIDFLLITVVFVIAMSDNVKLFGAFFFIGAAISAIGLIAVCGYLLKIPLLTYYLTGVSGAMALHTAILFTLIGYAIILFKGGGDKNAA